jgi:hypothetical protein
MLCLYLTFLKYEAKYKSTLSNIWFFYKSQGFDRFVFLEFATNKNIYSQFFIIDNDFALKNVQRMHPFL